MNVLIDFDELGDWFVADAEILARPAPEPESRGAARQRLLKAAMQIVKQGDQEDAMQMICDDPIAERLEPNMDARYYWARGIVNFCECALGIRARS